MLRRALASCRARCWAARAARQQQQQCERGCWCLRQSRAHHGRAAAGEAEQAVARLPAARLALAQRLLGRQEALKALRARPRTCKPIAHERGCCRCCRCCAPSACSAAAGVRIRVRVPPAEARTLRTLPAWLYSELRYVYSSSAICNKHSSTADSSASTRLPGDDDAHRLGACRLGRQRLRCCRAAAAPRLTWFSTRARSVASCSRYWTSWSYAGTCFCCIPAGGLC